jgi:hypothetical protein
VKHRARFRGVDETGEAILDLTATMPTLNYRGTVKLHGSNAAVVYDYADGTFSFQSRERVLTLQQDNATFMLSMSQHRCLDALRRIVAGYVELHSAERAPQSVALFGEWCGQGVQSGVAVSQLPKMFVIFAVKFYYDDQDDQDVWVALAPDLIAPDEHIYCIEQFPFFDLSIDFNFPELAQNQLGALTEAVEQECPVGKAFGVCGVGEGIVWRPTDRAWGSSFWFKVKGEKHSITSVKVLAPIDVEAVANVRVFVEQTATEPRFLQGVHWLQIEAQKPLVIQSMGAFIQWVTNDVIKEENETIIASQLDIKQIRRQLADAARIWFAGYLNKIALSPASPCGSDVAKSPIVL